MKVFLSYIQKDKTFAERITKDLSGSNIQVNTAEKVTQPGDFWYEKIVNAVNEVDSFLLIISSESLKSSWINLEASLAMSLYDKKKNYKVIPILINKDISLPPILNNINYIDFSDNSQYKENLNRLIISLKNRTVQTIGDLKLRDVYEVIKNKELESLKQQEEIEDINANIRSKHFLKNLSYFVIISLILITIFTVLILYNQTDYFDILFFVSGGFLSFVIEKLLEIFNKRKGLKR